MCHDKPINNACECNEHIGTKINSYSCFIEIKEYFETNLMSGMFIEIPVEKPYFVGEGDNGFRLEWYADKWYKCKICGCLWEFNHPDFPAMGFVKKFTDGKHVAEE